ncbi:hypothetical protein D3C87_2031990 [compost metagenome]
MTDMTVRVIATVTAERVPIDRPVVLKLERRVSFRIKIFSVFFCDGCGRLFVICRWGICGDKEREHGA